MSQLIRIILPIAVLAVGYLFVSSTLADEKEMPPPRIGERRIIEAQANLLQKRRLPSRPTISGFSTTPQ